jgi:hypothetical protein
MVSILVVAGDCHAQDTLFRIRSADPALSAVMARGRERSPTFRMLIDNLEKSDWLIFVQPGRCPHPVMVGCLLHMVGRYEGRLYLRLVIPSEGHHPDAVTATIAHELQHALELISDGRVTDRQTLAVLSKRIATDQFRPPMLTEYETAAARRIGELVLRELAKHRRGRTE